MSAITPQQLIYAALVAGCIAVLARMFRLLTYFGALAALVVGFLVFGFGGLPFAIPLLAFFFSSSLLSRIGRARKARFAGIYDKSATRDAGQVLANGGVAAVFVVLSAADLRSLPPRLCMLLYLAALTSVNADTWATEIGVLSRNRPFLVTTFRSVDPGTSGAVSLLGMAAALLGALFVAMAGWLAWPSRAIELASQTWSAGSFQSFWWPRSVLFLFWRIDAPEILAVTWAGFVASFADSVLGASIQARYCCGRCGVVTERREHCGTPARLCGGWRWVTNDVVNLLTSLLGVLFAWLLLTYVANPT